MRSSLGPAEVSCGYSDYQCLHNLFRTKLPIASLMRASSSGAFSALDLYSTDRMQLLRDAIKQISGYMDYLLKEKTHMLPPPVRHRRKYDNLVSKENNEIYDVLISGDELTMEAKMEAVLGVWVEMLCYAASYCNRESHARELSNGSGEFVTIVWLLRAALFKAFYPDDDGTQESARTNR
jgi:hypothetical protein